MDELNQPLQPQVEEFLWRRLETPAPPTAMLIPVAFGFVILLLWLMFSPRRKQSVLFTYMGFLLAAGLPVLTAAPGAIVESFGLAGYTWVQLLVAGVFPLLVGLFFRYWFSWLQCGVYAGMFYIWWGVLAAAATSGDPVRVALVALVLWGVAAVAWFLACVAFCAMTGDIMFMLSLLGVSLASVLYFLGGEKIGFLSVASWWYILVPCLAIGLFYIAMMYLKDSRSVHPAVAGLLGFMRCLVYAIIATVFLLPGCQMYDIKEYHSKSLVLFDVSRSMDNRDSLSRDDKLPPTRKDKVLEDLLLKVDNGKTFFERLNARTPLTAYAFGSMLDERGARQFDGKQAWNVEQQRAELKPLVDPRKSDFKPAKGANADKIVADEEKWHDYLENLTARSNYGGAIYQLARLEGNADLQALIIVGDGSSNLGSDETLRDALALFTQRKRPVPIITIGVGSYEQPASIKIQELQVPESARPDDKFLVRVPVIGSGLIDEDFTVTLKVRRKFKLDDFDNELKDEPVYDLGPIKAKFEGVGDNPRNQVDFEIDIEKLKGIKTSDEERSGELEGKWEFVAVVPRHERESFPNPEHVSEPVEVVVQKRKMRVLLFAGGPSREYQLLRTALYREVQGKRLEMSIYLQHNEKEYVDQDVEADRFLAQFPTSLVPAAGIGKYMALTDYDVIIAVDVDWTQLSVNQLQLVKDWVGKYAGGVVFVAGPIHTFHLARPGGVDISALKTIFPVELKDSRLHSLNIGHDPTRKYVLNFPASAENYDFLKLDEKAENHLQGWDNFFWGTKGKPSAQDAKPKNGFFNYYPVDRLRPDSYVLATFAGPVSSRINEGKDEQPFFVGMRYGTGRTMYVGSSETWRLIHYNNEYHKRFWIKLMRHVGSNTAPQKKYGTILLARTAPAGAISIEALIKGSDLLPAAKDSFQRVHLRRLDDEPKIEEKMPDMESKKPEPKKKDEKKEKNVFDLKPKENKDDWNGNFTGTLLIHTPGEYEVNIPIEGTNQSLTAKLTVRKPNPELDNPKPELERLFQMASDVNVLLKNSPINTEAKNRILELVTGDRDLKNKNKKTKLYFTLSEADKIDQILTSIAPRQDNVKGKQYDLWDKFWKPDWLKVSSFWAAITGPWIIAIIGFVILMIVRNYAGAIAFAVGFGVLSLVPLLVNLFMEWGIDDWPLLPVHFSVVLIAVVGLLGMEWFLRKLLKLA